MRQVIKRSSSLKCGVKLSKRTKNAFVTWIRQNVFLGKDLSVQSKQPHENAFWSLKRKKKGKKKWAWVKASSKTSKPEDEEKGVSKARSRRRVSARRRSFVLGLEAFEGFEAPFISKVWRGFGLNAKGLRTPPSTLHLRRVWSLRMWQYLPSVSMSQGQI